VKPLPFIRHSLGAEELIELGRTDRVPNGNKPFLAGRTRVELGQPDSAAAPVGTFVQDALTKDVAVLGSLSLVPIDIMAKSEAVSYKAMSDLLVHVASADALLARILLLGAVALQLGLPVRDGLRNLLGGIAGALGATGSGAQNQKALDEAQAGIVAQAPDQASIKKNLDAMGITGDDLLPEIASPALPPPAGVQGSSILSGQRPPVMLVLTRG
jgi:hypothetical protein